MKATHEILSSIIQILSRHPEGLRMKDIADSLTLNRNAVAKYLGILHQQGQVDVRHIGQAKIFTVFKRIPFSILAEISPDYVIGTDRNLTCIAANTQFYEWAGCSFVEVIGKHIDNLPVPAFQRSKIADLVRNGISSICEPVKVSCSLQNRECTYEIRCVPVIFVDDTTGTAIIIKDITNSETAAVEISLLQEKYRALADAQSEYIIHSSPDGTITYANPAFAALAKIPVEQLTGKRYRLKIPDDDLISVKQHFRSIRGDDPEKSIEHRVLTHSGEIRWIRWTNRGIFREGTLTGYHSHGIDITELKTARNRLQFYHENTEKMIQEKTGEFQKINRDLLEEIQKRRLIERNLQKTQFCINNSSEMILWTDENGTITSSNKSALDTLGILPGSIPRFMRPGISSPQQSIPWQDIREPTKENGYFLFEAIVQDRNDKMLHAEVLVNYLYYDDIESFGLFIRDITVRKQVEDALRENEEKFRALSDNSPEAICVVVEDDKYVYVNNFMSRITGYSKEEIYTLNPFDLVHPEDREAYRAKIVAWHMRKSGPITADIRFLTKNKETRWAIASLAEVTFGGKTATVASHTDITERRKIEEELKINYEDLRKTESALRVSEDKFRNIFNSVNDAIHIHEIDEHGLPGKFIEVNEVACTMVQYSRDELLMMSPLDYVTHYHSIPLEQIGSNLQTKGRAFFETGQIRKDGVIVPVEINAHVVSLGKKNVVVSVIRDITERKHAENALIESEHRYREIFDNSSDVLYLLEVTADGHFRNLAVNQAFEKSTGLSRTQLLGRIIEETVSDETTRIVNALYHRCAEAGDIIDEDVEFTLPIGKRVYHSTLVPLRDDSGRVYRILGISRDITEKKRMEEALRESEGRLHTLVQTIPDLIWLKDADGVYITCNSSFEQFFGVNKSDLIGKSDFDIHNRELAEHFRKNDRIAMEAGKSHQYEEWITSAEDGRQVLVDTIKTPMHDPEGKFVGILGIARDITERKWMEDALRESENRLQGIVHGSPIPQFVIDKNHRVISWNEALEDYTGILAGEVLGKKSPWNAFYDTERPLLADLLVDNAADKIPELYKGIFNKSKYVNGAFEGTDFFPKMGETGAWLYFTASPIRDTNNNIIGAVETLEDITERKRAEEALRTSEEKFRSLIQNSSDIIRILDHEGRIVYTSPSTYRILGFAPEELIGHFPMEYIHPEDLAMVKDALDAVFRKRNPGTPTEFRIRKKDGYYLDVESVAVNLFGVSGIDGIVTTTRPITERKRMDDAIRAKNTDLEAAYEEITANEKKLRENYKELLKSQQELRETQEELVRKEKLSVIGTLSWGIGYELRNPIGAIKNSAYFLNLALDNPDAEVKDTIEIINMEIARSEDIISSLLDFARPKVPVQKKVSVNTVLNEAISRYNIPKNVTVINNFNQNIPDILADPDKLIRVVGYLITNASEAMPDGGTLTLASENTGPDTVAVTVKDTGIGITEEHIDKIFEPLFTTKAKGIGLGLAVSKKIVEAHGGRIDVQSVPGKGTVFTVILPVSGKEDA